jgi:LmbE family N-acetylglucosaminyl deacetylase
MTTPPEPSDQYTVTGGGPVMAIFAHPDDPEFVAGGALALWAQAGRQLIYVICTDGSKGSSDPDVTGEALIARRQEEQRAAARHLGCEEVVFLPYEDAMLEPTIALRRDLVRQIRKYKPQIVVCFDPTVYWIGEYFLQHPDHRASGEAALAAIYPAARDRLTFPELLAEGLEPHAVDDIYMAAAGGENRWIDIGSVIDLKVEAMLKHESQFGDGSWARKAMRSFARRAGEPKGLRYAEAFRFVSFATQGGWFDDDEE